MSPVAAAGTGSLRSALVTAVLASWVGCTGASDAPDAPGAPGRAAALVATGARPTPSASGRARPSKDDDKLPPPISQPPAAGSRLLIGGGSFPESTEVSLEQDLQLAREVMGPDVRLLFAGGASVPAVRVLSPPTGADGGPLLSRLGELFAPRAGRASHYRRPELPMAARATADDVRVLLRESLELRGQPLWLHVAAHGEQGEAPRDNLVGLWAGSVLHVDELARLHDTHPRPLRVVIASCYSGGFAELAFVGADEQAGAATAPRCGLFAGTWDRQTSGCDPDPDRRRQQGYSLHFLNALRGRDRSGRPLPLDALDVDGDAKLSMLEAHTRARVQSPSLDVPTTTSERLLRSVQRRAGKPSRALLPEEWAVVSALGARLSLENVDAARARWNVLDGRLTELDGRARDAEERLHEAYLKLATELLSRWPVLDDPYHPDFKRTFEGARDAIAAVLDRSVEARAYDAAQAALQRADDAFWALRVDEALLSRYLRAHETLELASALHARGGADWDAYARMLACERWVPPLTLAGEGGADGVE